MAHTSSLRLVACSLAACALVAFGGVARRADAQAARIVGTVSTTNSEPLAGARIFVTTLTITAESRRDGSFVIAGVPDGTYDLKVYHIGYRPNTVTGVVVKNGDAPRVTTQLERTPVMLDAVVASVSRRAESVIDAPAAVTQFDTSAISNVIGSPITNLLKQAPGIDLTQVGVMSSFVNGRGFNKVFNSRWLTVEDGRVALFPETGLPIGEHSTIPKVDIADLEVIAGPGSALFGANASGGVLSVTTKDPRRYPGATLELSGGTRSYRDLQLRYAGSRGRWGFKVAAQHQAARDWSDTVLYAATVAGGAPLPEVARPLTTRATRASGSLRYYLNDDSELTLNAGLSLRDALGHSANGRYQVDAYRYNDVQLLFRNSRWFAQAYATNSNSADTYRYSALTYTHDASPTISLDSARRIAAWPVDGRIQDLEVQNNEIIGSHIHTGLSVIDNSRVTWGVQVRRDRVWSYGRLYTDAFTGEPIHVDRRAFYAQIETRPAPSLRVVGAARYDTHSSFPSRWSPKIGVLYDVAPEWVLRLTYNGAYVAPSVFQSDIYSVHTAARYANVGSVDGFDIRDSSGTLVKSISRLGPETNQTWELGLKGKFDTRLYFDATVYRARMRNFITQAGFVADPFAPIPTFAFNHRTGRRVEDWDGNPVRLLTSVNVGEGNFAGFDAGFRFYVNDRVSLASAVSLSHIISIRARPTDPPEATSFNSSAHRSNFSVDYANTQKGLSAGMRARYVEGYAFQSGTDRGRIPSFATLGAYASYRLSALNATLFMQADNLLACVSGVSTPPANGISATTQGTYSAGTSCGFGKRHHELLNMPSIGTMVFAGVRREWQ